MWSIWRHNKDPVKCASFREFIMTLPRNISIQNSVTLVLICIQKRCLVKKCDTNFSIATQSALNKSHVIYYPNLPILTSLKLKSLHLCPNAHPNTQWWRHQMEIFSALLALWAGNSPVTGEFPAHRPMTSSFDELCDLRLNKRLRNQSWGCWF